MLAFRDCKMEISQDTLRVVNFLQEFSNNSLRKRKDIEVILEIAATKSNPIIIEKIVFVGKSIWNLNKAFSRSQTSNSNLQRELENSFYELQDLLYQLIQGIEDQAVINRFNDVYLQRNLGCFRNSIDLSHDLAKLKELIQKMQSEHK